jgi:hypothetical protein
MRLLLFFLQAKAQLVVLLFAIADDDLKRIRRHLVRRRAKIQIISARLQIDKNIFECTAFHFGEGLFETTIAEKCDYDAAQLIVFHRLKAAFEPLGDLIVQAFCGGFLPSAYVDALLDGDIAIRMIHCGDQLGHFLCLACHIFVDNFWALLPALTVITHLIAGLRIKVAFTKIIQLELTAANVGFLRITKHIV